MNVSSKNRGQLLQLASEWVVNDHWSFKSHLSRILHIGSDQVAVPLHTSINTPQGLSLAKSTRGSFTMRTSVISFGVLLLVPAILAVSSLLLRRESNEHIFRTPSKVSLSRLGRRPAPAISNSLSPATARQEAPEPAIRSAVEMSSQ